MKSKWNTIASFTTMVSVLVLGFVFLLVADQIFRSAISGYPNVLIANNQISNSDFTNPNWFKESNIVVHVQSGFFFLMVISLQHTLDFFIYSVANNGQLTTITILNNNLINIFLLLAEIFIEILLPLTIVIFFGNFFLDLNYLKKHRYAESSYQQQIIADSSARSRNSKYFSSQERSTLRELRIQRALGSFSSEQKPPSVEEQDSEAE